MPEHQEVELAYKAELYEERRRRESLEKENNHLKGSLSRGCAITNAFEFALEELERLGMIKVTRPAADSGSLPLDQCSEPTYKAELDSAADGGSLLLKGLCGFRWHGLPTLGGVAAFTGKEVCTINCCTRRMGHDGHHQDVVALYLTWKTRLMRIFRESGHVSDVAESRVEALARVTAAALVHRED